MKAQIRFDRLRQYLTPPIFKDDEDKTRLARTLYSLSLVTFIGVAVFGVAWLLIFPKLALQVLYATPVLVVLAIVITLARAGRIQLAGVVLVVGAWLDLSFGAYAAVGVRTPGFAGYILAVLLAGILFGGRASYLVAALSALSGLAMVLVQTSGIANYPAFSNTDATFAIWLSESVFFVVAAGLLHLATFSIRDSLNQLRRELKERRRIETALAESRAQLAGIIESAMDAIITMDSNQRIVLFNKAAEKMFGYTAAGVIGQTLDIFVPERVRDLHRLQVNKFGETNRTMRVQGHFLPLTALRADGTEFPMEASISQVQIEGKKYFTVILRDITERERAQEQLRFQSSLLHQVLNAIVASDAQNRITYWNLYAEALYGWRSAQVIGRNVFEVMMPEGSRLQAEIRSSIAEQGAWEGETVFRRKDGTTFPAYAVYSLLRDDNELPFGFVMGSSDISEQKQTEAALRESEEKYRTLVENISDVIFSLDARGFLTYVSPAIEYIAGYTPDELVGHRVEEFVPPQDLIELQKNFDQVMRGEAVLSEYRVITKAARMIWVRVSNRPRWEGDQVVGVVGVLTDITERKHAEEALRESEENYRGAITAAGLVPYVIDYDNQRFTFIGENILKLTGYAAQEITPAILKDSLQENNVAGFGSGEAGAEAQKRFRLGEIKTWNSDMRIRTRTGEERWLNDVSVPVLDEHGRVMSAIGVIQDLTERKRAEEKLRAKEKELQTIFDLLPVGVSVISEDRQMRELNPTLGKILDMTEEGLRTGQYTQRRYLRTDGTPLSLEELPSWRAIKENKTIMDVEMAVVKADGARIWVNVSAAPLPNREAVVVTTNITDRKNADEALRNSEDRYHDLVENSHDLICMHDLDGRILFANRASVEVLGYSTGELLNMNIRDLLVPEMRERFDAYLAEIREHGTASGLMLVQTRNGERRIWEYTNTLRREGVSVPIVRGIGRDITEYRRSEAQINHQLERLTSLRTIDMAISNSLDLNLTLRVLLEQLALQLKVDAAEVMLLDNFTETLVPTLQYRFRQSDVFSARVRLGQGVAGRAALERRLQQVPDLLQTQERLERGQFLIAEGFVSYCSVPLISKGAVKGVLNVFSRKRIQMDDEWLSFLEAVSNQAAIAIDNAELYDNLQRSNLDLRLAYDTTLEGWSRALDLRDKETEGHTQRVTDLTERLARLIGVSEADIVEVRRGGLLHDIGKMGVPDNILLKTGTLTGEEWLLMRKHPVYAYELLSPITYLRKALDIPYCHHEKWDGTGYPRGLRGEEIPLAARIFAVVDVWDAIRSDRPYRKAWSAEKAREHIRLLSGTHFDPHVVEAFLKMIDEQAT